MSSQSSTGRDRAVVIGAGIAGLTTARVLSDHFDDVVVLERDTLPTTYVDRKGVPQGRHVHHLMPGGLRALERLLPGFAGEAVAHGAIPVDVAAEFQVVGRFGRWAACRSDLLTIAASRALFEGVLRSRVRAIGNVRFVDGCNVLGVRSAGDTVTAVRYLRQEPGSATEVLDCDLVVDAAGKATRTPAWLEELGFPVPSTERLTIGLTYLSNRYRVARDELGGAHGRIVMPAGHVGLGAVCAFREDGTLHATVASTFGDSRSRDLPGGLQQLGDERMLAAIDDAESIGPVSTSRTQADVRRHYERLSRHPRGLLVIGDALTVFNPAYAQGMTVAALEAEALAAMLPGPIDPRRYYRRVARIIDAPWDMAMVSDRYVDGVEGHDRPYARLTNWYLDHVHAACTVDPEVALGFAEVIGLVARPSRLMRPTYLARVWRGSRQAARLRSADSHRPTTSTTNRRTTMTTIPATRLAPGLWNVDSAATAAAFTVSNVVLNRVTGTIAVRSGSLEVDADGQPRTVRAALDAASFDTGNAKRDADICSPRFLDVERHPEIRYLGDRFVETEYGWLVAGQLTVGASATAVTLEVRTVESTAGELTVTAHGVLDRTAAGIRAPAFVIGRQVEIRISAALRRSAVLDVHLAGNHEGTGGHP